MVGPSLPASAKSGSSWSQTYKVLITSTVTSSAGTATNITDENVSESCNVIGMESVTVAAGTFNALHVTCNTSTSAQITSTSQSVLSVYTDQADEWYAANVGLVKSNDQGTINNVATSPSVLELTAYKI
jgi:hypothetical protein